MKLNIKSSDCLAGVGVLPTLLVGVSTNKKLAISMMSSLFGFKDASKLFEPKY